MQTLISRQFQFLRIERAGPGGIPVSECRLLDISGLAGDPTALSSFITAGLLKEQADRLEELFALAGVEIRRELERPDPAVRDTQRTRTRASRVPTGNPAAEETRVAEPANLFKDQE